MNDLEKMQQILDAVCVFSYAQENTDIKESPEYFTAKMVVGSRVKRILREESIAREYFELKSRLQSLEEDYPHLKRD